MLTQEERVETDKTLVLRVNWDYSREKLHKLDKFDYKRFMTYITRQIDHLSAMDARKISLEVSVMTKHDEPENSVRAEDDILRQIKKLDASIPPELINERAKFNVTLTLTFDVMTINDCSFEKFMRQFKDVIGSLRQLLNCGKIIMPPSSLSEEWAQVIYKDGDDELSTGGLHGRHIAGWNTWTMRRLYNFIYHITEEQDESEKKRGFNTIHDCPKLYQLLYTMRHDESLQEHYRVLMMGYDDADTFEKKFYLYMVPRDPYSEYGTFEKMISWLNDNIVERMNLYDEYELVKNNSKVTVTLKISCNGFMPRRTDGKKELKYEFDSPNSGVHYKYMFYDAGWNRYNQAKRGGIGSFSNGMIDTIRANAQFREDLENGLFGAYAAKTANDETDLSKYNLPKPL